MNTDRKLLKAWIWWVTKNPLDEHQLAHAKAVDNLIDEAEELERQVRVMREALGKIAAPCAIVEAAPDEQGESGWVDTYQQSTRRRRDIAREALAACEGKAANKSPVAGAPKEQE